MEQAQSWAQFALLLRFLVERQRLHGHH